MKHRRKRKPLHRTRGKAPFSNTKIKPIFFLGLVEHDMELIERIGQTLTAALQDYHVLVYPNPGQRDLPKLDVFYAEDVKPTNLLELKKLIINTCDEYKL